MRATSEYCKFKTGTSYYVEVSLRKKILQTFHQVSVGQITFDQTTQRAKICRGTGLRFVLILNKDV